MTIDVETQAFLAKAEEALASAASEFATGRFNCSANRSYFACFLAAVTALLRAGLVTIAPGRQLGHDFVQSQFVGQLINRRKTYPSQLREVLARLLTLRQIADYEPASVSRTQASRALSRANEFVSEVRAKGGETL